MIEKVKQVLIEFGVEPKEKDIDGDYYRISFDILNVRGVAWYDVFSDEIKNKIRNILGNSLIEFNHGGIQYIYISKKEIRNIKISKLLYE